MKINKYKKIRLSLGLSLKEFCAKSQIGLNTWIRLEREDNSEIYAKTLKKLVNNCNVNLEYLIGDNEEIFKN